MENVIRALESALGKEAVLTGDEIGARYTTNPRGESFPIPIALMRPRSTGEVATILRICNEHGQPVVPQGGLTGLCDGASPRGGDVAISLERMSGIEEIDTAAGTLTAFAGTPLQTIQEAAQAAGFLCALDLGARGSCFIGGNVSTNAGENRVLRYGMARDTVLGLEVVLADGTVLRSLNKMIKNNTGYDLTQLFIGSEGTLGSVTRVVLRLHPLPASTCTALCALRDFDRVIELLRHAQGRLAGTLSAFEAMWPDYYDLMTTRIPGNSAPLAAGAARRRTRPVRSAGCARRRSGRRPGALRRGACLGA
ncbi:MAG: FAD-binding oxidoreductase [Betaproteobacteria bacterium]|nr:FAD-binding oxidoreductase [Betaproteobacteria bacterium]